MMQRREDAGHREQPRAEIGQRNARLDRRAARLAGDRHDPGDALRDEIETALGPIGSCLPVAGNRRVDQPRIDRPPARRSRGRSHPSRPGDSSRLGCPTIRASRLKSCWPSGDFRFNTRLRLPRFTALKLGLSVPTAPTICRVESPDGGSILITSAPEVREDHGAEGPGHELRDVQDANALEGARPAAGKPW